MSELLRSPLTSKISTALIISLLIFTGAYFGGKYVDDRHDPIYNVKDDRYHWTFSNISTLMDEIQEHENAVISFGVTYSSPMLSNNNYNEEWTPLIYEEFQGLTVHRAITDNWNRWFDPIFHWDLTGFRKYEENRIRESHTILDQQMSSIYDQIPVDLINISNLVELDETIVSYNHSVSRELLHLAFDDGSYMTYYLWETYLRINYLYFDRYQYYDDSIGFFIERPIAYYEGTLNHSFNATTNALIEVARSQFT